LVYDQQGDPFLVIECKSPDMKIDQNVMQQVATYSKSLKVKYIGVSNGLCHYCWAIDQENKSTQNLGDYPLYK
jgi:hypothetical protein